MQWAWQFCSIGGKGAPASLVAAELQRQAPAEATWELLQTKPLCHVLVVNMLVPLGAYSRGRKCDGGDAQEAANERGAGIRGSTTFKRCGSETGRHQFTKGCGVVGLNSNGILSAEKGACQLGAVYGYAYHQYTVELVKCYANFTRSWCWLLQPAFTQPAAAAAAAATADVPAAAGPGMPQASHSSAPHAGRCRHLQTA